MHEYIVKVILCGAFSLSKINLYMIRLESNLIRLINLIYIRISDHGIKEHLGWCLTHGRSAIMVTKTIASLY